jgi:hypothetical protein
MKHLAEFITTGANYPFETPATDNYPARRWLMRQPTPDEAASGDSAYRITYNVTMKDRRLRDLAQGDKAEIEREARIRANAAESIYMLPLLLIDPETNGPAFDVADEESLAEFEALDPEIVVEMTRVYWEVVKFAIDSAKKKSTTALSSGSGSRSRSERGPSRAAPSGRPGPRS